MSNYDKPREYSDKFNDFLVRFGVKGYGEYINSFTRDEQKICEREYLRRLLKSRL